MTACAVRRQCRTGASTSLLALSLLAAASGATADTPQPVALYTGFGGVVNAVDVPAAPKNCSASSLTTKDPIVLTPAASGDAAICVTVTKDGVDVNFIAPFTAQATAIDFDYPPQLSCVTLRVTRATDLLLRVVLQVQNRPFPVECDVTRAFVLALAVERQGPTSAKPTVPDAHARAWKGSLRIPWSIVKPKRPRAKLTISAFANGAPMAFASGTFDTRTIDDTGTLGLDYAPFVSVPPPASSNRAQPRLHAVGGDAAAGPAQTLFADLAVAQNGASTTAQRSIQQIVAGSPVALPANPFTGPALDTLNTRTQPLMTFLKPSKALGDQDLQLLFDAAPFTLTKVGSLASGYAGGYGGEIVTAAGFYGLQRPGTWNQAYAVTVAVPTPQPKPTPTPTPTPSASPAAAVKQSVAAPPPFARPGTVEESKTSHDPLMTISLIDAVSASNGYVDSTSGAAFGTNFYRNTCDSESAYCAVTFHVFGAAEHDAHPRVTSPALAFPRFASRFQAAGESATYTHSSTAIGSSPSFVQFAEMISVQQADRFYFPAAGSITPFTALNGSVGHLVASFGTGRHEHVYSADLLGIRLSNAYGDVFTDIAWQLAVPFDLGGKPGFSLHTSVQSETLSDRVAALQQGLASSYYATIYPNKAALAAPVAAATVRPQSQYSASLDSPPLGSAKGLSVTLSSGYQTGFVTNCAPAPVLVVCARGHDHAVTLSLFATQRPYGFGLVTGSSASIPGDLAIATTSRYFGSYVNSPGSLTTYVTFSKWCVQATGAYSNAAYPVGIPLPQRGSTVGAKVSYPFGALGLEAGYSSTLDTQDATQNQSGFYTLLRLHTGYGTAKPPPCT